MPGEIVAPTVAIGWPGLPAYAARCIAAAEMEFPVIATRPGVPIQGMEEILPGRIHWIGEQDDIRWSSLRLTTPEVFFQPSWSTPAYNRLGDQVRAAGGRLILMFDNPWKGTLRQALAAIRFRTVWRRKFDAAWVTGAAGVQLAKFWGFPEGRIFTSMYGADPDVFNLAYAAPLAHRPKRIAFVGRLIKEKGIRELIDGWNQLGGDRCDWHLDVYGVGDMERIVQGEQIAFHGFQQPGTISKALQESRFLILPSYDEHWGLVVCEAAQCGCGLLLSNRVASHKDLLSADNGRMFEARSVMSLQNALRWAFSRTPDHYRSIQQHSERLGRNFTPQTWRQSFNAMLRNMSHRS